MDALPEILFATSDPAGSRRIRTWIEQGKLRRLFPRVYTSNMQEDKSIIVSKNIWLLISKLLPQSHLSHRSALEYVISPKGNLYLTAESRRVYRWPGINLRITKGPGPIKSDPVYMSGLTVSSLERACLENLSTSRTIEGEKRTVSQEVIEHRLMDILYSRGEEELNTFRDRARLIAGQLHMPNEFEMLNQIISSILATQPGTILKSARAHAQVAGEPYDSGRLDLFSKLLARLKQTSFPSRPERTRNVMSFANFAFFEAYFSNYIEGTTFLIEEAKRIIYDGVAIPMRIKDTHDIKGTFQLVSDRQEMLHTPETGEDLITLLRQRHSFILAGRPEKDPGAFKSIQNRAGETIFVEPQFVIGTLKLGFELMSSLEDPVARAIYMMFLVSEVHPFSDGNGGVARIMMNAELVRGNSSKIIIPTVFRDDYLTALRKLSRKGDPGTFVRMMDRASAFSHWLEPGDWNIMHQQLLQANAFKEADEEGAVLTWPL